MWYTVTIDTFPTFLAWFAKKLTPGKKFVVEVYDADTLVINSKEYLEWRSDDGIDADDFILQLKNSYDYPQS